LQLINPSTSSNELNTTLTPHSIIHGHACFAYFNKVWGIPFGGAEVGGHDDGEGSAAKPYFETNSQAPSHRDSARATKAKISPVPR